MRTTWAVHQECEGCQRPWNVCFLPQQKLENWLTLPLSWNTGETRGRCGAGCNSFTRQSLETYDSNSFDTLLWPQGPCFLSFFPGICRPLWDRRRVQTPVVSIGTMVPSGTNRQLEIWLAFPTHTSPGVPFLGVRLASAWPNSHR